MNMNYNNFDPATIYRSIFAQNIQIPGRKYILQFFAYELFKIKKNVNNTRNTYMRVFFYMLLD